MAISRSSALQINTEARITHLQGLRLASLLSFSLYVASVHAPLYVWVAGGKPRIEAEWKLKWNSETGWSASNNTPVKCYRTKGK